MLVFGWNFSWCLVEILKIKCDVICVWTCDMLSRSYFGKMNSTLGSVVPLAMFLKYLWVYRFLYSLTHGALYSKWTPCQINLPNIVKIWKQNSIRYKQIHFRNCKSDNQMDVWTSDFELIETYLYWIIPGGNKTEVFWNCNSVSKDLSSDIA